MNSPILLSCRDAAYMLVCLQKEDDVLWNCSHQKNERRLGSQVKRHNRSWIKQCNCICPIHEDGVEGREELQKGDAAPKGLGHPSSILPCSGEGVLCSLGEMGTTLHRKLPAHRCFVQVTELTAMLERSTWLDYLTDKDTALAAGAKGGSIWEKPEPSPVLTTTKVALKWLHSCMKV